LGTGASILSVGMNIDKSQIGIVGKFYVLALFGKATSEKIIFNKIFGE
jgi:hypothetical protein